MKNWLWGSLRPLVIVFATLVVACAGADADTRVAASARGAVSGDAAEALSPSESGAPSRSGGPPTEVRDILQEARQAAQGFTIQEPESRPGEFLARNKSETLSEIAKAQARVGDIEGAVQTAAAGGHNAARENA